VNRAVFLDRDGVINAAPYNPIEGKLDSPYALEDFRLLPGAAVNPDQQPGLPAVVVSNQPGVAKGKCDPPTQSSDRLHGSWPGRVLRDAIYYCLHHPSAGGEPARLWLSQARPGLLLRAARVWHNLPSRICGRLADRRSSGPGGGCRTILLSDERPTRNGQRLTSWRRICRRGEVIGAGEVAHGDLPGLGQCGGDPPLAGTRGHRRRDHKPHHHAKDASSWRSGPER
jgi:histidinol phosphatase-like enzyme